MSILINKNTKIIPLRHPGEGRTPVLKRILLQGLDTGLRRYGDEGSWKA